MSGNNDALVLKDEDVKMMIAAQVHVGAPNVHHQMKKYVYERKDDGGNHLINIKYTWEKILLAARAIVAIENPKDVCIISARTYGQRPIMKFASYTGAYAIAGRFTPGALTNHAIGETYREPRVLICVDPLLDHQAIKETAYTNLPVISLCNTDSIPCFVDIAIPCNNKGIKSLGLVIWMLTREILRMRGTLSRQLKWEVMVDLFFHRELEELEKETKEEDAAMQTGDGWNNAGPTSTGMEVSTFGATPAGATSLAPGQVGALGLPTGTGAMAPAGDVNWADASWDPTAQTNTADGW